MNYVPCGNVIFIFLPPTTAMLKIEAKFDRTCTFIALGGGVIGDLVGFAAAVYQRGINFVQVVALTVDFPQ